MRRPRARALAFLKKMEGIGGKLYTRGFTPEATQILEELSQQGSIELTGPYTVRITEAGRYALAHPTTYTLNEEEMKPNQRTVFYTTAPADYDGFGTEALTTVGTYNHKPLRKVRIHDPHISWQMNRYWSGLHPVFTEKQFHDLLTRPWFTKE